jgi:lysophospholipase L1-like esterase
MKILAIGDSITFGEGVHPHSRWTSIFDRALYDHEVINKGVCGDTTRLGLERFPEDVQRQQPDALLIQFGLNDCNRWDSDCGVSRVSPRAFEANVSEMIERARTFDIPHIAVLGMTPTTKDSCLPQWWRYAGKLKTACEHEGATFINPGTGNTNYKKFLLPDGVHLNERGNQAVAHSVLGWLAPLVLTAGLTGLGKKSRAAA